MLSRNHRQLRRWGRPRSVPSAGCSRAFRVTLRAECVFFVAALWFLTHRFLRVGMEPVPTPTQGGVLPMMIPALRGWGTSLGPSLRGFGRWCANDRTNRQPSSGWFVPRVPRRR